MHPGPTHCTSLWVTADVLSAGGSWKPGGCPASTTNATNAECPLGDAGPVAAGGKLATSVVLSNAIVYTLGLR